MKILWLVNFEIPMLGNTDLVNEGWITGMLSALMEYYPDNEIYILYPQNRVNSTEHKTINEINAISYYEKDIRSYDSRLKLEFQRIIEKITPEVIHVMGTEYPHTLSMCEACKEMGLLDNLVVSVQGMPGLISKAYFIGLPYSVRYGYRLKDVIYGNVKRDKKRFEIAGEYEKEALVIAKNIIGRTEWDEMCVKSINKSARYWRNNENLRKSFYDNTWRYDRCEPNTVFISQGNYPIKGMHILIESAKVLRDNGYEVKYRIAGENIFSKPNWKWGKYTKYIYDRLKQYNLIEQFAFLGKLDEKHMVEEYLRANIFVLPSLIENSPNSLGEAMILGMPVIAADVGGVKNFIRHGENGYIFPLSEPYMVAYYVEKYLESYDHAIEIGQNAKHAVEEKYDRKENSAALVEIYHEMVNVCL